MGSLRRFQQHITTYMAQWGESFFKHLCFVIIIVFWLKWAGYLAVAGMNLLPLIQAYFLGIFKKLKARKTQPPKKLKAIFCRKTQ